jgi:UDP-N-acetylmuramate--alanine ligase
MSEQSMRIHIVGAGGAGMSAIAKVLAGIGHVVTGSDLRGGSTLERLDDFGVSTYTGHRPDRMTDVDLVVASSAVPDDDVELVAAAASGKPVWRRPQLLGTITERFPTIGATGTHGKTTTTALLIAALRGAGLDPSFIVGGDIAGLNTNGHFGNDDLLVIEADEAFRTFEAMTLRGLVITNVEPEHLDHFGGVEQLVESFVRVARGVDGPVVACIDDPGAAEIARRAGTRTYGTSEDADWRIVDIDHQPGGVTFDLVGDAEAIRVEVHRPGVHVARNAAGALALVGELGHDMAAAAEGVARFQGIGRRWEHRGTVNGVMLIDDYAHHPTEISSTLEASRGVVTGRIWAVFQPHLYSRTERFHREFGQALASADVVVVTDIYGSREEPVPGITGALVAEAVRDAGTEVHYIPHKGELADFLSDRVVAGDMVLTMGAGDITLLPAQLAALLGAAE